jgi:GT2 family glycosyltransferase
MTRPAAEKHGARIITLARQCGPAEARNTGVAEAAGDIVFFTDADVLLHPDAIGLAANALRPGSGIAAVIGSYDDRPTHNSFISQYRNLFHHWVHQAGSDEASTFWTGCGAIRRSVFLAMGGFNRDYRQPSIEDIELGMRLRRHGHRIRLLKNMHGTHMKRWRFRNTIYTDTMKRALPWMLLVLREGQLTNDLNLNYRSRVATLSAAMLALVALLLVLAGHATALLPAAGLLLAGALAASLREAGRRQSASDLLALGLAVLLPIACYLPLADPLAPLPLALLLALAATHLDFYRYVAKRRSLAFALAVLPMQLLFFLGCAVSIPLALGLHLVRGGTSPTDKFTRGDR